LDDVWTSSGYKESKLILAACELGYTIDEIAFGLDRSSATIRRHIAALEHKVFSLTGLAPSHTLLAKWTREHHECCTRPCLQLLKDRQVFDGLINSVAPAQRISTVYERESP
jgi:predicted transcriptional regulator